MSAVGVRSHPARQAPGTTRRRKRTASAPQTRSNTKARAKGREKFASLLLAKCLLFSGIAVFTYFFSSMSAQLSIEEIRREGRIVRSRLADSDRAVSMLRSNIAELKDEVSLAKWAVGNDLIPPSLPLGQTEVNRVASR